MQGTDDCGGFIDLSYQISKVKASIVPFYFFHKNIKIIGINRILDDSSKSCLFSNCIQRFNFLITTFFSEIQYFLVCSPWLAV